jgi:hypothetical protein
LTLSIKHQLIDTHDAIMPTKEIRWVVHKKSYNKQFLYQVVGNKDRPSLSLNLYDFSIKRAGGFKILCPGRDALEKEREGS